MSPELLKKVRRWCRRHEYKCKVYRGYSGRCMYGNKTDGVVVDRLAYGELMGINKRKDLGLRSDNMAFDYIIY